MVYGRVSVVSAVSSKKEKAKQENIFGGQTGNGGLRRILVTGGTGLVGKHFAARNKNVLVSTRNPTAAKERLGDDIVDAIEWMPSQSAVDLNPNQPIDAIVNLAGESIAGGRWNAAKKKRIYESRILGTRNLIQSIRGMKQKPSVLISASAVGIYGDAGDLEIDETHPSASGFLGETCRDWENEARAVEELGIRLCILRIGIVMSLQGGALAEMLPVFKSGFAGRLGAGRQYFPWIHIDDLVSMIGWAIDNETASGVFNATSPNPVTNREYTRQLATQLNRPAFLPAPKFALRAVLGEFANSLFDSQRVVPKAAMKDGFKFQFNELDECLADLFQQ